MTTHVSLDLETMGTGSYAAIVSIGAIKFDPNADGVSGPTFYMPISLASSMKAGLRADAGTIMWWFDQSLPAIHAWTKADKVDLDEALLAFSEWYGPDDSVPVWGNGAAFDNVILSNAYQATGIDRPWNYKADRCFRTVKEIVRPLVSPPKRVTGIAHNALDDAMLQALWLQKIARNRFPWMME